MLAEAEERARTLLSENREALDAVVAELLEKETMSGQDLMDVVRRSQGALAPAATAQPSSGTADGAAPGPRPESLGHHPRRHFSHLGRRLGAGPTPRLPSGHEGCV